MKTENVMKPNWRDTLPRQDRVKICQHIMQFLSTYYTLVPVQAIREKTAAFESQSYTRAGSLIDYLQRIAVGLSNVEQQHANKSTDEKASQISSTGMSPVTPSSEQTRIKGNQKGSVAYYAESLLRIIESTNSIPPHVQGNNASYEVPNIPVLKIENHTNVITTETSIGDKFQLWNQTEIKVTVNTTNWHDAISIEDRIKICQYVLHILLTYYSVVPEQALRERTSAFERLCYIHGGSRIDYLQRIATGLSKIEQQQTNLSADEKTSQVSSQATSSAVPSPQQTGVEMTQTGFFAIHLESLLKRIQ